MTPVRRLFLVVFPLLPMACAPAPETAPPAVPAAATAASPYDTGNSIQDVMKGAVVPNAQLLWNAVSYVVTAEGSTEKLPQTDADWLALRNGAIALIEAGNALMIPGRAVGEAAPGTENFQYTPDEIAKLLAANPERWQGYAQLMQESTRMTLQAIEFRDLMGLQEFGAQINEACEGCHADYWYRPPGSMVPQ